MNASNLAQFSNLGSVGSAVFVSMPVPSSELISNPPLDPAAQGKSLLHSPTFAPSAAVVNLNLRSYAGFNPWWTFQAGDVPGVGKYYVNASAGLNMILQSDDMSVPNTGISLDFRRTYNLQSLHDYVGTDGAQISNYGNGWTNTFDAHLAINSGNATGSGLSVYDIDGARYDYLPDGKGHWTPPTGQYASLIPNGAGTGYYWVKKNGTTYGFFSPTLSSLQPQNAGINGRNYTIWARNRSNWVSFGYAFDNPAATTSQTLSQITVLTQSGQKAVLTFGNFSGRRLLSALTAPDQTKTFYFYDTLGNLAEIDSPINSSSSGGCSSQAPCLKTGITYVEGSHLISAIGGPRWEGSVGKDGGAVWFQYQQSGNYAEFLNALHGGYINPIVSDGYSPSTPIQPTLPGGSYFYRTVSATSSTVSGSLQINFHDSDGHQLLYYPDTYGRIVKSVVSTGSANLTRTFAWDNHNNLVAESDYRGAITNYEYDANGNLIAEAGPLVDTEVAGGNVAFRPTSLFSYDSHNNLTAHCTPDFVHNLKLDWTGVGPGGKVASSDLLCPSQTGASRMIWTTTFMDSFGELSASYLPLGYHHKYAYDPNGRPTSVVGDQIQQVNGSTVTPTDTLSYDAFGNLRSYSRGVGTWSFAYDAMNRLTEAKDPDDVPNFKSYYSDGALKETQTAAQAATGMGVVYTYDADGNPVSELHHYENIAGLTRKWYDADNRLIEVMQPRDKSDFYPFPWLTRYLYDLTSNKTVSIGGPVNGSATYKSHGNLFATQEYLANSVYLGALGKPSWLTTSGKSYDALDRELTSYTYVPGGKLVGSTNTYDQAGQGGFLNQSKNPDGDLHNFIYDAEGKLVTESFTIPAGSTSTPTSNRTMSYDPVGRLARIHTTLYGDWRYSYDLEGRLTQSSEPTGGSSPTKFTSPATLTYQYYLNGWKSTTSVSSAALTQSDFFRYDYRADGLRELTQVTYGGKSYSFGAAYTNAGRLNRRSDPYFANGELRTYDSSGEVSSETINLGQFSGITHDAEGEGFGWGINGGTSNKQLNYTVRGELLNGMNGEQLVSYANGLGFKTLSPPGARCKEMTASLYHKFDARNGALLGSVWAGKPDTESAGGCKGKELESVETTISFDAAGRSVENATDSQSIGSPNSASFTVNNYDTENRLTFTTLLLNAGKGSSSYGWGPRHPILADWHINPGLLPVPAKQLTDSLHWDGDQLLFTTTDQNKVDAILFEDLAQILPNDPDYAGLNVFYRDFFGQLISLHNTTGDSCWTLSSDTTVGCTTQLSVKVPTLNLVKLRLDGYTDQSTTIQGVRTSDPGNLAWSTPDEYPGDIHDPMSQKPYVWNRNNPYLYSDPSGYVPAALEPDPNYTTTMKVLTSLLPPAIREPVRTFFTPTATSASDQLGSDGKYDANRYDFGKKAQGIIKDRGGFFNEDSKQHLGPVGEEKSFGMQIEQASHAFGLSTKSEDLLSKSVREVMHSLGVNKLDQITINSIAKGIAKRQKGTQ